MKHPSLDTVLSRLDEVNQRLSDLLGDTRGAGRVERGLARVDWMVSLGIREIHQGRKAGRDDILILGQIAGFNNAALNDLRNLLDICEARPFVADLARLQSLIAKSTNDEQGPEARAS